jgi:hypothetical protein
MFGSEFLLEFDVLGDYCICTMVFIVLFFSLLPPQIFLLRIYHRLYGIHP